MEMILCIPILLAFFITLFFVPIWIKRAKRAGLVGKDMHKEDKRDVAEGGGIIVLFSFILGVLCYIAIKTFVLEINVTTVEIFTLLTTILLTGIVGLLDDILGWKIGLNKKTRLLLMLFAAVPLMVINAGESRMMGIEFGLFYPLFFIPLGIIGASTTYNFLAGYNGLETSQGILILAALSIVTFLVGETWLSLIAIIMVVCLIAFYLFNKYPAKVLPGDVLTYPVGALIAIIAILGNVERIAVFFFIPYIIETGLKIRGGLKKQSFAKIGEDGGLEQPYEKIYGLEHLAIRILKKFKKGGRVHESEVVYLINLFQIIVIILGFVLLGGPIFN